MHWQVWKHHSHIQETIISSFTLGKDELCPCWPYPEKRMFHLFVTPIYVTMTRNIGSKPTIEEEDWYEPFIQHIMDRRELPDPVKRAEIQQRATRFTLRGNQLYRQSLNGILLHCLSIDKAATVMTEVHAGVCRGHQSGPKLQYQLKRLSYYWPTMVVNCIDYAKRCHVCQLYTDYGHVPAEPLHTTSCSWPFSTWGMDIV